MEKMKTGPAPAAAAAAAAAAAPTSGLQEALRSRQLLGQGSPREFLQRIFPTVNPNVLELVYQGCGGNLERAIEQLVSSGGGGAAAQAAAAAAAAAASNPGLQQIAIQQRLAAAAAMAAANKASMGNMTVPNGYPPQLLEQIKHSQSAFSPLLRPGMSQQRPMTSHGGHPAMYAPYQALLQRLPYPLMMGAHMMVGTTPHQQEELLSQRSAFQHTRGGGGQGDSPGLIPCSPPCASSPHTDCTSPASPGSSHPSPPMSPPGRVHHSPPMSPPVRVHHSPVSMSPPVIPSVTSPPVITHVTPSRLQSSVIKPNNSPIKFSVESIIGRS